MKPWKRMGDLAWTRKRERFNGATAMKPWKSERPSVNRTLNGRLQWGHGDEAVEETIPYAARICAGVASMGPRR